MKKILFVLVACFATMWCAQALPVAGNGDDNAKTAEKIAKAKKKAVEKRLQQLHDSVDHLYALDAIQEGYYVIMADRMMLGTYSYTNPQPNTNFVLVQGDKATVQFAFDNGRLGQNGLGGITVEGTVTGLKVRTDKKGQTQVNFNISGAAVSAQVFVTLYKDSNESIAVVNSNFGPGSLTVYGKLIPYNSKESSETFKGSVAR